MQLAHHRVNRESRPVTRREESVSRGNRDRAERGEAGGLPAVVAAQEDVWGVIVWRDAVAKSVSTIRVLRISSGGALGLGAGARGGPDAVAGAAGGDRVAGEGLYKRCLRPSSTSREARSMKN